MTVLEQINNQEVDNQISVTELRDAIKPGGFLSDENNIKEVGKLLNNEELNENDKALVESLTTTINSEIKTILERGTVTEEDIMLINVRKELLGGNDDRVQRLDEIINDVNRSNTNIEQDNQEVDIALILQELDNEIETALNSPLNNLQELGIDISLQNNKKGLGINWVNILNNIKSLDDLGNISEDNVDTYLNIPNNIPKENYRYIAENLKNILYTHLTIHPEWKTIFQKGGYASGRSIEGVANDDAYIINLLAQIENLQKKSLEQQVEIIVNKLPNNSDLLDLWLKRTINSDQQNQEIVLTNLFDKIPVELSEKFFQTCEKNTFINELKDNYALYRITKNNCIKSDGNKYCFLDWTNKSKFEKFYGKGIKLSDDLNFDNLYSHTKNFYTEIQKFGFDTTIPLSEIIKFLNAQDNYYKKIKNASDICERETKYAADSYNPNYMPVGGSPSAGHAHLGGEIHAAKVKFQSEKSKACAELEKEYVKVLLQKKPKPIGDIMGISGAGIALKFDKDPGRGTLDERADKIVRDTFTEQLGDQREKFKYDLKNDRQAAFGSAMGMIGGIAGSAAAAIFTKNIWATSAGFTAGLRLGNGIGQEIWNSGEYLYEQVSGNKINDGNNKVENFGQGFLRGVGALDQNYEYVGTAKFLSGLGFDYLSTVATFGLSQKFGGFLGKLEGVKFAGGALKFGMEELILENFFVDIPMNIVQSGFEAFTGIDNGGVTVGNTSMGNERTVKGENPYQSGSLSDMLRAMKDATTQNLSFENLSQTFFNTIIYGGFLEGGGAAIKKMKGYLPSGQVSNFTERSAAAATAFAGLTNFMSSKNINFNKDGICIDTKTNLKIEESDPRFKELISHIKAVEATKAGVIESFETIMETQKQMVADPENRTGLLFRLGLISPTNTPLNILKKKKELVEKKLIEAKSKGDDSKIAQLQRLLDIYTDAETKLNNAVDDETKILTKEDFDTEFNNIEPENEKQKICLEACKKSFDDAYNELPNLLEQIKQNPSKRQELIENFMEKYQLSINESKSDKIKRKKTLTNEQKVFFIDAYNSFIFKPLNLKYIDTSVTLGGASAFVVDNSKMMDSLAKEMTQENQDAKLNDLREEISRQYTERYGKPLNLTDEQLLAVIEAHKSAGKIGDLTYRELRDKVEILISNKVEDEGVRRFLIESGFCGSIDSRVDENFIDIEDASPNLNLSQDWVNTNIESNENGGQRFDSEKAGDELLKLQNKSLEHEGLTQGNVTEIIERIEDPVEKTIAKKLRASLDSKIPEGDQRVSIEDKAFMLGQSLLYLQNYRTAHPDISPKEVYELLNSNQNKILHQQLRDLNTSTSSDHGIKHILRGNMTLAEKLFEFVNEEGLSPQEVAQRRVLTMQAIIDHDLGYTNFVNKLFDEAAFGKGFHMVSDHPLWSTLYVKEHADFYKKYFGEAGYNALITSIPGHSNAQLGYLQNVFNGTATLDQTVRGILSCVDCAGSPGDYKIAFMFAQKEMIGGLFNAKKVLETNNADAALQSLNGLRETVESMPDGPLKDARRKGIDAFLLGVNDKMTEIDGRTKDHDGYQKEIFNEENCRQLLTESELQYIEDQNLPKKEKVEGIKQLVQEKYGDKLFEELENVEYEKLVLKYPNLFLSEAEIKKIKSTKFDEDPKRDKAIKEDEMKAKGREKWKQMSSAERKKLIIDGKKMKEMDDLFGFKMGKFLGAYGVQTSIDEKTGIPICGKSDEGGFAIQFELAGESFSYLAEQLGTKTALKSFTGVSEDYIKGYEDSHAEAFVIKFIEQVSNNGQISGKNFDLSNVESIISEFCKSSGTEMMPISENRFSFKGDDSISIEIKGDNSGLILHGPNGVEITLKFDGKSYEGFNNSVETISKIESRIDDAISRLDINEGNGLNALKNSIANDIADIVQEINDQYGDNISWSQEYLDKIANDIVNLDENTSVDAIKQKIKEIRYAYHFNMNTVGTSTNPVDNK